MPEVKETERKCRGLLEASDTQVDGTGTKGGRKGWPCSESFSVHSRTFLYIEAPLYKELDL